MKVGRILDLSKLITAILLTLVIFSSCGKDDELSGAYVGTWREIPIVADTITTTEKSKLPEVALQNILMLTSTTYEISNELKYDTASVWIPYLGEKGVITVSKDVIFATIKQITYPTRDLYGNYTGVLFADEPEDMQTTKHFEYKIESGILTVKSDDNLDNVFGGKEDKPTKTYSRVK